MQTLHASVQKLPHFVLFQMGNSISILYKLDENLIVRLLFTAYFYFLYRILNIKILKYQKFSIKIVKYNNPEWQFNFVSG